MKARILILLLFSYVSLMASAQVITGDPSGDKLAKVARQDSLDKSILEIIYQHRIYDPVLKAGKENYDILQTGKAHSKYWSYDKWRIDSVVATKDLTTLTSNQFMEIASHYRNGSLDFLLRYKQKNEFRIYGRIFADGAEYWETVPTLEWQLTPDTTSICGYPCRKAEADFRGRHWIVWYTEEIPSDEGPWKLNGLPGMILKATSADLEHQFKAVIIRKGIRNIYLTHFSYFNTTREKFNQSMINYKWNVRQYVSGHPLTPKDVNGNEMTSDRKRLFYNPLEKE